MNGAPQCPTSYRVIDDRGDDYTVRAEDLCAGSTTACRGWKRVVRDKNMVLSVIFRLRWGQLCEDPRGRLGSRRRHVPAAAKGMADAGNDWAEMIKAFYPEAEVVKGW